MQRQHLGPFVGLLALLLGCGSETTSSGEPSGSGGTGGMETSGGGPGGDGGMVVGGGGTGGVDAGGGPATSGVGEVRMVHGPTGSGVVVGFVSEAAPSCQIQMTEGDCSYLICDADRIPPPQLDAGDVAVSGGFQTAILSFDAMLGIYPYFEASNALFGPGDTVSITVAGSADVPAMSGDLVVPAVAELTAPDLSALSIDTSLPLELAWTGGGNVGEVDVRVITPGPNQDDAHMVFCQFSAALGAATVPASLLGDLPGSATEGSFGASLFNAGSIVEGDWTVDTSAGAQLTSASSTSGLAAVDDIPIQ